MSQPVLMSKGTERVAHVHAWRASGEKLSVYCARVGMKESTLRYWVKRVKRESSASPVRMARVRRIVPETSLGTALRVVVGHASAEVPPGFDASTLSRVLEVLSSRVER